MSTKENKNTKNAEDTSPTPLVKMKNKSLTIKDVQTKKKKMNQLSTYILDVDYETNTNTIIKYYKEFDHKRIESLLQEAMENVKYSESEELDFFTDDNQLLSYIMWLISVRFTSLSKDVPTTLPEQIPLMLDMLSTGLMARIHEEVLNPEQVYIILEKLDQFTNLANQIANLDESTRNEIMSTVQNKEIIGQLHQGEVIHPLVSPDSKLIQ